MKKFVLIAVPLAVAVALAVAAYVFLAGGPEGPEVPAESAPARAAPERATTGRLPEAQTARAARQSGSSTTQAAEESPPERDSEERGDLTSFSLTHGEIGYVDVNSVLQDRDPYSVVALLQEHRGLTGADESLEVRIERIAETEIWGHEAIFTQLIEGQPTNEGGRVFFTSNGAVTWVYGDIINPQVLAGDSVLILPPEAEAIAREAAARYAVTLEPERPEWRGLPVIITAHSAEMRHELDSDYALFRLWRVPVSIDGPAATTIWVSVSPDTGEVISVKSAVSQSSSQINFILCDAAKVNGPVKSCWPSQNAERVSTNGTCNLASDNLCQQSKYAVPLETVKSILRDVQATSSRSISSPIHIVVGYHFGNADGDWNEYQRTIRLDGSLNGNELRYTAAHEAFHAASKTPEGSLEHGLVYAMTAIWTGTTNDWHYKGNSVRNNSARYTLVGEVAANVIYRVFQQVGKGTALQFVLDVDLEKPANLNELAEDMETIGKRLGIGSQVASAIAAARRDGGYPTPEETSTPTADGGRPPGWNPPNPWDNPEDFLPDFPDGDDDDDDRPASTRNTNDSGKKKKGGG